ncbi:hypothetical protein BJ741DRAFT_589177 [Chytriomyces cf. hyalinus JEL632]|nr:hypothetical protein BJ741DRAFT_589177 [Chytriomyces cf. hyalinus JEL632]
MVRRYLLLMQLWTHALCGSMTYYNPAGGLGSCGNALFDGDYVAAMNAVEYSLDRCGQTICISYGGKTVQAVIADRCAGCSAGDVDVTPVIFEAFQPLSVGRFDVTWDYCGGGGGGSGSGGNGRQEQPSQQPSPSPPPPPSPASSSVPP